MRENSKIKKLKIFLFSAACFLFLTAACQIQSQTVEPPPVNAATPSPKKTIADRFAYPIGKTETITEAKDRRDDWYNAQNFAVNNHLGEDWNKNTGGNTDCGEPVFAAADGTITFAEDAGTGWGNVVIIEHDLPDGKRVQTLYGHLQKITKTSGAVKLREQIGTVGNADGKYWCHLHFELRTEDCPEWNKAGAGYAAENKGWLDPSKFIDKNR